METSSTHVLQGKTLYCSFSMHPNRSLLAPRQKRSSIVVSVASQPGEQSIALKPPSTATQTTGRYNDNWLNRLAIHYLSQNVQATTGLRNDKSGYDSLVEAATALSKNYDPTKQRELVILALDKAFPRPIMSLTRMLLPQNKFTRELFAAFTTVFFTWLVGPCEVKESELNGRLERNVVHIKKCRFLEESNCVGMCTNLCKIPSQTFIKDSLGMPVTMVPNFDDMRCDMIFGEEPPALKDDPALKQPCYKLCKANRKIHKNCSS